MLAAYDLGAPSKLLQAIFDAEKDGLDSIHLADRKANVVEEQNVDINKTNWQQYVGEEKSVLTDHNLIHVDNLISV